MANMADYSASISSENNYSILFDETLSLTDVTNSTKVAWSLLEEEKVLAPEPLYEIDRSARVIGKALKDNIIKFFNENVLSTEEDLILLEELPDSTDYVLCTEEGDDKDYKDVFKPPANYEYIPLEYKRKAVVFAQKHPNYSLKTLNRAFAKLTKKDYLVRWKRDVESGGTFFDKVEMDNAEKFARFKEARKNREQVTTRVLQQWAMSVTFPLLDANFNFIASHSWARNFKRKYRIKQRKVTKFVSKNDVASLDETLAIAETFQRQTRVLMKKYPLEYVINTDQSGCQYEMVMNRSLDFQGTKIVLVQKQNLNKISHSYTVQYSLTAAGTLLPHVFICTQERGNTFGPRVSKTVEELTEEYGNVIVTCSKSGKLTKKLFINYLEKVLKPYVCERKFLLLLDSWGGQADLLIYDDIFTNESDEVTCTVKVIPPKCTSLCQPCDVYFYRQVKNIIKRLQDASNLLQEQREINTREDAIKIHSIIHHQLSSPVFNDMLKHAWYGSKLLPDRIPFMNVNEACFPLNLTRESCDCNGVAFIKCARCRETLCFKCFYDDYHPQICEEQ